MTALSKSSGYFVTQLEKLNGPIRTSHWSLNFNFNELINYENIIGLNYNVFTSDKLSLVTPCCKNTKSFVPSYKSPK